MIPDIPQTRWAETVDGLDIAYQEFGAGPVTIVLIAPWLSHVEVDWELPRTRPSLGSWPASRA